MKRNKTFKLGLFLMVLTLMTSCLVGNTFAKYVSTGEGSDSARVAKWGVNVTATSDAFSAEYVSDENDYSGKIVVKASDGKDVIAPGTNHNLAAVNISGNPEVAVKIQYEATEFDVSNWKYPIPGQNDSEFYCPLIISFNDKDNTKIYGLDYSSESFFEEAVKETIASFSEDIFPGEWNNVNPPSLSWEWKYEGGEGLTSKKQQDDAKDTYLGNLASDDDTFNDPTISLTLTATVTQID